MKQLFIIVVLFHDKINKVKALWGTVNHLKVYINIMKKTSKKLGDMTNNFGVISKMVKYCLYKIHS